LHYADQYQNVLDSDRDLKQATAWWSDELNGKHTPRIWPNRDDTKPLPTSADALDKLLWVGNSTDRELAIGRLAPIANRTSVPYLLVALYDPDPVINYKSYAVLNRLIGKPNKPISSEVFGQSPEDYTSPLIGWWKAELQGRHRPPPLHGATYIPVSPELFTAITARIKEKDASSP
jgi:hypothetical protein